MTTFTLADAHRALTLLTDSVDGLVTHTTEWRSIVQNLTDVRLLLAKSTHPSDSDGSSARGNVPVAESGEVATPDCDTCEEKGCHGPTCAGRDTTPKSSDLEHGEVATHDLKCWPDFFEAIVDGRKRFEYRNNDRYFKLGDILNLREWDPGTEKYTGRYITVKVTYLLDLEDCASRDVGYVIMSIVPVGQITPPAPCPSCEAMRRDIEAFLRRWNEPISTQDVFCRLSPFVEALRRHVRKA